MLVPLRMSATRKNDRSYYRFTVLAAVDGGIRIVLSQEDAFLWLYLPHSLLVVQVAVQWWMVRGRKVKKK